MDSEDERELEALENHVKDGTPRFWDVNALQLRLYQQDEAVDRRNKERILAAGEKPQYLTIHRLNRFFHSIMGFHSGFLDLTGRHPQRYSSLFARWNKFLDDYKRLAEYSFCQVIELKGPNGEPLLDARGQRVKQREVSVEPPEILREFEKKWRLGSWYPLEHIFEEANNLVDFLIEHPEPIFQKLLLQDLPPDLLHRIMDVAGLEGARLLGSASRSLREIASGHIYSSRTLQLSIKLDWVGLRKLPEPERGPAIASVALASRDRLVKELEYICSRSDIVSKLQNLYVIGHWKHDDLQQAGLVNDEQGCEEYYGPIMQGIRDVLSQATNVRSIKLAHLYVNLEGAKAITAVETLNTFELRSCSLPSISGLPQSRSVLNGIMDLSKGQLRQWQLFMPFSNLRVLSLFVGDCEKAFPPLEVLETYDPFKTIERFAVTGIEAADIGVLSTLFRTAKASDAGLKLTHLKVAAGPSGLHQPEIKDLLDALSGSPLQYLVLDGIYYAETDLLDLISAACPDLLSLTLSYRQSTRQVKSEKVLWPRSSWEYAPHLKTFRKLKHFRWNFHLNFEEPVLTGILGFFEDGFKEDWYDYVDLEESFSDWDAIARVLAAYCPTLTNVSFLTGSFPVLEYRISRSEEKLVVKEEDAQIFLGNTKFTDPDLVRNVTWPQINVSEENEV